MSRREDQQLNDILAKIDRLLAISRARKPRLVPELNEMRVLILDHWRGKPGRNKGTPQTEETRAKISEGVRRAHERRTG
jgi:hypothetical protein